MLAKTYGSAVYGVDAITITVEVNVSQGNHFYMVGLPDSAVKESEQRVESALKNHQFRMPRIKVVVNLAPADIRKEGSAYDLPIALGILHASEQVAFAEHNLKQVVSTTNQHFCIMMPIGKRKPKPRKPFRVDAPVTFVTRC